MPRQPHPRAEAEGSLTPHLEGAVRTQPHEPRAAAPAADPAPKSESSGGESS